MRGRLHHEPIGEKEYVKVSKQLKDMGKPTIIGNDIKLTQDEFKELKALAQKGVDMQDENRELKKELKEVKTNYNSLVGVYNKLKSTYDKLLEDYDKLKEKVQPFLDAIKYAPEKVWAFITNILGLQKQEQEQARELARQQKKQKNRDRGGR